MKAQLFQLIDITGERMGLYASETKDGQDLDDLSTTHTENALEAMEDITLQEFIEQNGFERVFVEEIFSNNYLNR